jgi:hypothetical protein
MKDRERMYVIDWVVHTIIDTGIRCGYFQNNVLPIGMNFYFWYLPGLKEYR